MTDPELSDLLNAIRRISLFHDPSGSAGYYSRCNTCGKGATEKEDINHQEECPIPKLCQAMDKLKGQMNERDCKHGQLARSCEICEARMDCIRLQQEINCLRMEPCQLPECVKTRAELAKVRKELRDT